MYISRTQCPQLRTLTAYPFPLEEVFSSLKDIVLSVIHSPDLYVATLVVVEFHWEMRGEVSGMYTMCENTYCMYCQEEAIC